MNEPYDTYIWEADAVKHETCSFPQAMHNFRDEFCSLTKNKTVAFVGDSLTREQFVEIGLRTGWDRTKTSNNKIFDHLFFSKENKDKTFVIRTCPPYYETKLIYRRTFWMEVLNDFMMEVKHSPDVLVLNTYLGVV